LVIAVLSVQGAFIEHINILEKLGIKCIQLRQKRDLFIKYDGLILPGGESTVQSKLIKELDMYNELKRQIEDGLPVFATCAGLILLSEKIDKDKEGHLRTLPVKVIRNAYGRQLGSFIAKEDVGDVDKYPMKFIRAPYIEKVRSDVTILSKVDEKIVAVRYKNQIGLSFHPELTEDYRLHKKFIEIVRKSRENKRILERCINLLD